MKLKKYSKAHTLEKAQRHSKSPERRRPQAHALTASYLREKIPQKYTEAVLPPIGRSEVAGG
jgi:hypothetical protein